MEPNPTNAPLAANATQAFTAPVRITFYHTRARLADMDGISVKAAIDGLVEARVLATDSTQQVEEVRHRQSKGREEETTIVIEVADVAR